MATRILVTGAGGILGAAIMAALADRSIAARGMTRRSPVQPTRSFATGVEWVQADLTSRLGVVQALVDVTAVIHCASSVADPRADVAAIAHLISAAKATGGGVTIVNVGIAGIDRAAKTFAYYQAKLDVEQALAASGVPHVLARATQFHPFVEALLQQQDDGATLVVPSDVTLQPVSLEYAAGRLIGCALGGVCAANTEIHGPEALTMPALGRAWLDARSLQRNLIAVPSTSAIFQGFSKLDRIDGPGGGASWRTWLDETIAVDNPYSTRWAAPPRTEDDVR